MLLGATGQNLSGGVYSTPYQYAVPAGSVVTWNPSDTNGSGFSFSGGNLIITWGNPNSQVRSTGGASATKFYFEVVIGGSGFFVDGNTVCGIILQSQSLSGWAGGSGANSFHVNTYQSQIFYNGAGQGIYLKGGTTGTASGDVICLAVDLVNNRAWARINALNWNNSGTANPATNTGGIDISLVFAGHAAFTFASGDNSGMTTTANFGATTFAQTIPSGFSAMNTPASITVNFSLNPIQYVNNSAAFTINAPSQDGSCLLLITNGASAGTVTFSGWTVGSNTGDALDTINTHKFTLSLWRINGTSSYSIKSLQ
jgi:hypothetical protein